MISPADLVNGVFEGGGSLLIWLNIRRLLKDKKVEGVSLIPTAFWTIWGYWNLYYYPSLHQWLSFAGGLGVVWGNTVWIAFAIYYTRFKNVRSSR